MTSHLKKPKNWTSLTTRNPNCSNPAYSVPISPLFTCSSSPVVLDAWLCSCPFCALLCRLAFSSSFKYCRPLSSQRSNVSEIMTSTSPRPSPPAASLAISATFFTDPTMYFGAQGLFLMSFMLALVTPDHDFHLAKNLSSSCITSHFGNILHRSYNVFWSPGPLPYEFHVGPCHSRS